MSGRRPRIWACLLSAALAAGCSPREDSSASIARATETTPDTIVFDGRTIDVSRLREAVAGLCQASQQAETDPAAAQATYDRRAQDGVDVTVEILRSSYSIVASSMTETAERVQAGDGALADDLAALAQLTREGLARLGVTTSPCEG